MKKIAILLFVPFLTSCVALIAAGGAGGIVGYKYIKGELHVTYNKDFSTTWAAVKAAIKDMKLKTVEEAHDQAEGYIKAVSALGKKVKIKVKYNGKFSKVSIRVGTLGDLDYSLAIKYRIDAHLNR